MAFLRAGLHSRRARPQRQTSVPPSPALPRQGGGSNAKPRDMLAQKPSWRRGMRSWVPFLLVGCSLLAACAPRPAPGGGGEAAVAPPSTPRSIVMGVRYELISGQSKALNNSSSAIQKRLFNASLAMMDSKGVIHPYLAETLPQLSTESWQVFPDGRMETTYRLKPNLTWHDGTPFSAEDIAFAYEVYSTPELGQATQVPQKSMQEVVALDARTLVIRWRELYPGADSISRGE